METSATLLEKTISGIESDYREGIKELMIILSDAARVHATRETIIFAEESVSDFPHAIDFLKSRCAEQYLGYYGYRFYQENDWVKKHFWNIAQPIHVGCTISWPVE